MKGPWSCVLSQAWGCGMRPFPVLWLKDTVITVIPCLSPRSSKSRFSYVINFLHSLPLHVCSTVQSSVNWLLTNGSFQRSPIKSTLSPAPPHTARLSHTTWTSHNHLAQMSSTNLHSTPLMAKTRRTCARWPPPHLRARSVADWDGVMSQMMRPSWLNHVEPL